jgi:competence protein ComEA
MPRINAQLLVYLVVGAVLALVGLNSIHGEKSKSEAFGAGAGARSSAGGTRDAAQAGAEASAADAGFKVSGGSRKLIVDVAGAVRRPGVYRFGQGARVIDAIARAGGATKRAMLGAINRAATLSDGQQVVVPSAAGVATASAPGAGAVGSETQVPVSLGTATQEQLEEIDGIGPVTAQKILEFRDSQGGLGSIDDLDQISGIGPTTMESLRAALTP